MDRRRFLYTTAAAAATLHTIARAQTPAAAHVAVLTLHPEKPGPHVPANFIGLSYETQQLSDPTFFSAANTGLIAQFKALAPHGVLRLGGNTSDYGFWKPTPTSTPPSRARRADVLGDPSANLSYAIEPAAIHNLRDFLDATGWTCLYGINLGTNLPALAAAEAIFVSQTLGDKLEYFQIGNEADRFATTIRDPKTWSADAFFDEWIAFANAIREAVPGARFGMPDIASNANWFATIADRLAAMPFGCCPNPMQACGCAQAIYDPKSRPHIACLSHHYYIGGPPSSPEMTIDHILHTDPKVAQVAELVTAAATKLDTRWRMTEGNTCYRGGKPGVSDVFAAALWSADYLLQLASLGYAGVNLHGGDGQMVANSLGGKLPGDDIVLAEHGNPADHPHPYYTPIAHIGDKYTMEPVAYGMKFAGAFAGATMLPIDFDPGPVNATAYAAQLPNGSTQIAIINKDAHSSLRVELPGVPSQAGMPPGITNLPVNPSFQRSLTLTAPSLQSTTVQLQHDPGTSLTLTIPPATAVLFHRANR